ncbi:hypothetical protein [Rhodobacter calidifons]|uniref:Uncharacterized protein n=1 Tax=Rhodobacter calidifons TaxID=2715277 RepID=A0ABX0GA53_9RHOB|nr:hypothetical protein [Rhodobacter calidifons]NHB77743.1 hypothetical protein [Rhodobacter calidifons]
MTDQTRRDPIVATAAAADFFRKSVRSLNRLRCGVFEIPACFRDRASAIPRLMSLPDTTRGGPK